MLLYSNILSNELTGIHARYLNAIEQLGAILHANGIDVTGCLIRTSGDLVTYNKIDLVKNVVSGVYGVSLKSYKDCESEIETSFDKLGFQELDILIQILESRIKNK